MSIIEFIQDRARYYNCPVCGKNLRGCGVRMLNQVDDRYTVQVSCAACGVNFVIVLAIQGAGIESAEDLELVLDDDEAATAEAAATLREQNQRDSVCRLVIDGNQRGPKTILPPAIKTAQHAA